MFHILNHRSWLRVSALFIHTLWCLEIGLAIIVELPRLVFVLIGLAHARCSDSSRCKVL